MRTFTTMYALLKDERILKAAESQGAKPAGLQVPAAAGDFALGHCPAGGSCAAQRAFAAQRRLGGEVMANGHAKFK